MSHETLITLSAVVTVLALSMYFVLDGFDLGVGLLLCLADGQHERDMMIEAIEPVWDGNETWLILAGVCLWAGFPGAYSTLLPAFYLPLVLMLLCLGLRGVSFEFRQAARNRKGWDTVFFLGSFGAVVCQSLVLAGVLAGVGVAYENGEPRFAGDRWAFISGLTLPAALFVLSAIAFLGASWLRLKTIASLQVKSDRIFRWALTALGLSTFLLVGVACAVSPPFQLALTQRWPAVGVLLLLGALLAWKSSAGQSSSHYLIHYAWAACVVASLLLTVVTLLWPNIIPYDVTLSQAASPSNSLAFMLVGVALVLPVILSYTYLSYWVFRGRVDGEEQAP